MTDTRWAAITLVATFCLFVIGGRAEACSCWQGSACPTNSSGQLIFVATAHVQKLFPEAVSVPAEEPAVRWHDDFSVSIDVSVVGRSPFADQLRERTTLIVQRAIRGMARQQYQVEGGSFGMSCDYQFTDGEKYLVYAVPDAAGNIHTSVCTLTKPLRRAAADLAYLAGEGVPGLSGTVRGSLQFFDRKRVKDAITVVLERPDGERLFEIESERFNDFEMYPVPPGPYLLSVHLNESDKALDSKAILVAPGQCPRDSVGLKVGTLQGWSDRIGPFRRY